MTDINPVQIIIGTTPTICIELDDTVDLSGASSRLATIEQRSRVSKIPDERILMEDNNVLVCLEQRDTIHFREGDATLQVNWVYEDEARGAILQTELELLPNHYRKVMR